MTDKSAHRTGLKGYALPYGDVAVGGYLNTPKFLNTDYVIETAADGRSVP